MSRNHVSKVLVGIDTVNTNAAQKDLEALTEGQVIAFDFDTGIEIVAATKNIGFARGSAVLGEPIVAGPIPKAGISDIILNPYNAPVNKEMTLTVSAVPTVGKTVICKVIYHDNLSILPNQIKQTVIAVTANAVNAASTTTWAAALAAEFNKQTAGLGGNLFVTVTSATNVVTFVGQTLTTASDYNGIDRPETLNFEIGAPYDDADLGTYAVATTVALESGQGDPAKVAWMEDQAQGRIGYSDRRMWNNTKKFTPTAVAGETYATMVITADIQVEGDMQNTRNNPIGVVVCGASAQLTNIIADLARASIVPTTVAA